MEDDDVTDGDIVSFEVESNVAVPIGMEDEVLQVSVAAPSWKNINVIPKVFYVYPIVHATTQTWVEMMYVARPTAAATIASNIDLPDNYTSILLDYLLYRAFSKSTDSQLHLTKAMAYYEAFIRALGAYTAAESGFDPNNNRMAPSVSLRK
jgi:hypothetical protein